MPFNFMRGRQMMVHDPRVDNPLTTPHTLLRPPNAMNVWTVGLSDSVSHVVGWPAQLAARSGGLDAVHFLAHGYPGGMQIGAGHLGQSAIPFFDQFRDPTTHRPRVRFIVMFSCSVGGDSQGWYINHPIYFGEQVAAASGARVVVARRIQGYTWDSSNVIDVGSFEGEVDVYDAGGWEEYQSYNPFRTVPMLDLETLIFG